MKDKLTFSLVLLTVFNISLLLVHSFKERKGATLTVTQANNDELYMDLSFKALEDDGKTIKEEIKIDKPVFCVRFSFTNCSDCVSNTLEIIKKWTAETNINKIMIYGTFFNDRDFEVFKDKKSFNKNLYNVENKFLGLNLEGNSTSPFFFILFPDGSVHHVFIPIKENSERTYRYLEIIEKKYFEKN